MENFTKFIGNKADQYKNILEQAKALIQFENNSIANMANICALLNQQFEWLWIGFYLVDPANNTLVLGPFQGPIACSRISWNKGVCGTSWALKKSIIVPNVHEFPGHIACSSLSQSEIVVPCFDTNNNVYAVLDIDSISLNTFDKTDALYLEQIVQLLTKA